MLKLSTVRPIRDADPASGMCTAHGPYEPRIIGQAPFTVAEGCPQCSVDRMARREAKERAAAMADRLGRSNIPSFYQTYSLASYPAKTPAQLAVLRQCQDYARDYRKIRSMTPGANCLVFLGKPGTGKTSLACSIGREVAAQDRGVYFTSASWIRVQMAGAWQAGTTREKITAQLIGVDLLIIDEIGASSDDPHAMRQECTELFPILNGRYQANSPLILVSNLPVAGEHGPFFQEAVGDRSYDRLRSASWLVCNWSSLRK